MAIILTDIAVIFLAAAIIMHTLAIRRLYKLSELHTENLVKVTSLLHTLSHTRWGVHD